MEPTGADFEAQRTRWMVGGAIAFAAAWWLLREPPKGKKVGSYRRRRKHRR
jgi:hypothetical protein